MSHPTIIDSREGEDPCPGCGAHYEPCRRDCLDRIIDDRQAAGLPYGFQSGKSGPLWRGKLNCGICRSDSHTESFCPRLMTGQCGHGEVPAICIFCAADRMMRLRGDIMERSGFVERVFLRRP